MISATSHSKPIVCVGDCTWTTIFYASKLPESTTAPHNPKATQIGDGPSASAAASIVRLGGLAHFWGRVGDDNNACNAIASLVEAGVDCTEVRFADDCKGSFRTLMVDRSGEPVVLSQHRAQLAVDASGLPVERITRGEFSAVLVDAHWPEAAARALDAARAAGIPGILVADVNSAGAFEPLAARASHVLYSEIGLATHVGGGRIHDQLARAQAALPGAFIGVTRGADGFYWYEAGNVRHAQSVDVHVVDTFGAGAVFRGAYALALAERMSADAAAQFACVAASLKCSVLGARLGAPDRETMQRAMQLLASELEAA